MTDTFIAIADHDFGMKCNHKAFWITWNGFCVLSTNRCLAGRSPPPQPAEFASRNLCSQGKQNPSSQSRDTSIRLQSAVEPHEAPIHQLAGLVSRIVEIEGPIHSDEVARRVSAAFGKARTGSRITDATLAALKHANRQAPDGIRPIGDFWLTVRLIASEIGEMPPEDMMHAVARLMGFLRVGTDLQAVILSAIVH